MEDIVLLEWEFSPPDYFEEEFCIEHDHCQLVIKEGKVEARIDPSVYDQNHKMRNSLHEFLNNRFSSEELSSHKPYELSEASETRLHADGRKDVTIFGKASIISTSSLTVDIIICDKNGNILSDSKRDRIQKKQELAQLVGDFSSGDSVATSLMASYKAAVNDPDNELVHLYEIRDALSKHFLDEKSARKALNLKKADWSYLGKLANDEPLKQGRHRGKSIGELRDATEKELDDARNIARKFIEAYLIYLSKK
ncbi:MAG: hypothetical protein E3J96_02200 [Sulfurovum sp.]|nr:MAG: hypothetical protein E3J96_02200 [Sulfurovum sp.]